MKQGDIKTVTIQNEENEVKIALEFCRASGGKTMAIGNAKGMIDKGEWQSEPQPKLPMSRNNYTFLYRFGFLYQGFKFLCDYITDNKDVCFFIYPYFKDFEENLIVFSDEIKTSKYYQTNIYDTTIDNDKLKNIFRKFKEDKIFYSSDLCGTDFKQVINFTIRR